MVFFLDLSYGLLGTCLRLERQVHANLNDLPERWLLKETLLASEAETYNLGIVLFHSVCGRNLIN